MRAASKSRGVAKIPVRPALWFCACNLLAAVLAAQCSNPTRVPDGTYTSGDHSYRDNNALSAANFVLSGSATATLVAGNCIQLLPGFHATAGTAGTTFHAWVETVPADVSFSPLSGSGPSQPFTWTVSSPSGYSNLSDVYALFNTTSGSAANACYIRYNRASNLLYLADNSGLTWLGGFLPGSASSWAANSYCTIYGSGSSFSTSGTQLAVTVWVAFQATFSGTKNRYLIAYDNEGLNTTWQQFGTWTVPYYLTTVVSPSGEGTVSPGSSWWNSGSLVTITATPVSGYQFSGFTGSVNSGSNPLTVTMNSAMTETANFTPIQYQLTTTATSGGTVSPNCPSGCWYNAGSVVTVTASPNSGYQFAGFTGSVNSGSNPLTVTMNSAVTQTANFATVSPLTLPAGLIGINYFPRGHAWYSMLYDWYTLDCTTSTEKPSCSNGQTVAQVVAGDLQHLSPFNFIHLYLWDQDTIQNTLGNAALVTNLAAPGFTGWDNGGPQSSPGNQWAALGEFASLAKQNHIWLMLEFAVSRPNKEANLHACGYTDCPPNITGCPFPPNGWQYPANGTCPAGYSCSQFTDASLGCNYAAWVNSFIDYLAPYQNVLVWGANYGVNFAPTGPNDQFWQTSCGTSGQGAYQQIMSHLEQHPYSSPAGRALLALDVGFTTAIGPAGPSCPVYPPPAATGTDPQLGFYTSNWQDLQKAAYTWQHLPNGEPPPDIYAPQLWNANAGDLQAALECIIGAANTTCSATVQACSDPVQQCPIPASKIIVPEFGTGSSLEAGPIGNGTAGFGDAQTPTTTADGQAEWITQTLCAMNRVGVRNTGYFGLYDSYSWWASKYGYPATTLAWDGFWGLKSELPSSYNPNNDGQKPAWSALTGFNPALCPATQVPPTPVIAVLPPDGVVPTSGANPYYTVGDTANVYYTAANVTSLSMNATPGNIPAFSSWACDVPGSQFPSGSTLVGSCGYAHFFSMASPGTGSFALSGSNTDADHAAASPTAATPVSTPVTVGLAPILAGLVDFNNTSQQCNLTTNPGCTLTVTQLDTIELFGAGFNPTGGNTIELVNQSGQRWLSISDGYYFWDASRAQMNAQIGCSVPAGSWTLYVFSPNQGSAPSAGASITVNASAGCS
jgi:hypothetical protein